MLLSLLTIGLFIISCDKEDKESPSDSTALIGVWNYMAYVDDEGEEPATECEKNQIIEFKENGVFSFTYYDEDSGECKKSQDATGTWEYISDNVITLDYGNQEYLDTYEVEFNISENVLTLTIDEGEGEYKEKYEK